MEINADFTKRITVHTDALDWKTSPTPGVDRRMLDRIGDEVARATSIVRYAPQSKFPSHVHEGGEEFIVLEGVFQDQHGDYPQGWYIRNPPTSAHAPGSDIGCTIFVKLWQFDLADRVPVKIDMNAVDLVEDPKRPGVTSAVLYEDVRETVRIEQWEAGATVEIDATKGAEILVLEGTIHNDGDILTVHDWLRVPRSSDLRATAGPAGARIWVKHGHLDFDVPPKAGI